MHVSGQENQFQTNTGHGTHVHNNLHYCYQINELPLNITHSGGQIQLMNVQYSIY